MPRLIYASMVLAGLSLGTAAGAQTASPAAPAASPSTPSASPTAPSTTPSAAATPGPATAGAAQGAGVTGAGAGHRAAAGSTATTGTRVDDTDAAENARLNRALRSICRGC